MTIKSESHQRTGKVLLNVNMVTHTFILSRNKVTKSHLLQYMCTPYPQQLLQPIRNANYKDENMYLPMLTWFMYAVTGELKTNLQREGQWV